MSSRAGPDEDEEPEDGRESVVSTSNEEPMTHPNDPPETDREDRRPREPFDPYQAPIVDPYVPWARFNDEPTEDESE